MGSMMRRMTRHARKRVDSELERRGVPAPALKAFRTVSFRPAAQGSQPWCGERTFSPRVYDRSGKGLEGRKARSALEALKARVFIFYELLAGEDSA
jgi:hypothetical protein